MRNKYYAVIDTNVIVSALISKTLDSNPVKIIKAITQEQIIPLFNDEILSEYREVLSRAKFGLDSKIIESLIQTIQVDGISLDRTIADDEQFPNKAFVITPAQMVEMHLPDNIS